MFAAGSAPLRGVLDAADDEAVARRARHDQPRDDARSKHEPAGGDEQGEHVRLATHRAILPMGRDRFPADYAGPGGDRRVTAQLKAPADGPGRLPLPRRARRRPLRRQGEIAAPARAPVLPGEAQRQPARDRHARRARRPDRDDRHRQRGRGAPPRAEPRQAPPAAVQRPAPRRQVVPVHRRDARGRLPARDVHARSGTAAASSTSARTPTRRRCARRSTCSTASSATGRARGRSPAGAAGSRASITTSSAAWPPASGT